MKTKTLTESYETIEKVLSSQIKNKHIFTSFKLEWKKSFLRYNLQQGNPCALTPSTTAQSIKGELITIYGSPPKELKKILDLWRENHEFKCCPYCGDLGIPPTLDHFLPKDYFPEYSILLNNLVPCCSKCQPKKGNKYITNKTRLFYHPIFQSDEIKLSRYIQITITDSGYLNGERIFTPNVNLRDNAPNTLKLHFHKLGIKERLTSFCNREIRRYKKLKDEGKNKGIEESIYLTLSRLSELREDRNNWDRIFCISLLENKDFLNYLKN